jgi:hypothetical protein
MARTLVLAALLALVASASGAAYDVVIYGATPAGIGAAFSIA